MFVVFKLFIISTLLVCFNYVSGACPFTQQLYDVSSRDDDIRNIYKDYMSPVSYNTYATNCYQFMPQPPPISDTIINHALNFSIGQTSRYISLDSEVVGETGSNTPKILNDMDRNNYFFESATRYIQEINCLSKSTTTMHSPKLSLDKFQNYLKQNVSQVACDGGHVSHPNCKSKSAHRQADGTCNNVERPLDGSVGDCMLRLLPPDYKDGISKLRSSTNGTPLPNPKILSTNLFGGAEDRPLSNQFSQFQAIFGEFVAGDNGLTLSPATGMLVALQCCDVGGRIRVDHPQCAAVFLPRETNATVTCMQFVRSIPCARCRLGPRAPSSSVTAAQDLNAVYGVSDEMLKDRRTFVAGGLHSQTMNGQELFPVEKFNASVKYRCFEGKCQLTPMDGRNVLAATGMVTALMFHRNHNRHARNIAALKPEWNDEKIFQTARRWNIAEYQHCVYNEYLKTLIGEELMNHFAIHPQPPGKFSRYKVDVPLRTIVEFQSTAGRQGHTTLVEDLFIIDPKTLQEHKISLRDREVFERILNEGLVDGVLMALMHKPAFEATQSIPFKAFIAFTRGLDLAAIDIQRQRDHGIPGYIYYLHYFHNVEIHGWDDLLQFIDSENIEKLKKHYKNVEDIELYVGGHHERKVSDASVGPTFANIIGTQFHNSKFGDRFFYEHDDQIDSFSTEQLNEIKSKACFARIFCKNTILDEVLRDPLRVMSNTNKVVSCAEFEEIDYKL